MSDETPSDRGRTKARQRRVRGSWLIAIAIVALALPGALILFDAISDSRGDSDSERGSSQTSTVSGRLCASGRVPVDGRTCGEDSAPVKIVELSDYQCPFCKRFVDSTEPLVESEYIEKGLVQLEFCNLAITGGNAAADDNEATLAAEAAECANDQGRFWEYHYKLYAEQNGENKGAFLPEKLKQFAADLGLDEAAFDACLDSHKHIGQIEEDRTRATELGARGTPSFLIDGELVVGALSFEEFRSYVEKALTAQ
jgi:protein-disulfide isomerase